MDAREFQSIFPIERCEISDQIFTSKEQLLNYILSKCFQNRLSPHKDIEDQNKILTKLINREKMLTTGVGKGLAIPHCAINEDFKIINESYGYLFYLTKGMDFQALDDQKVFFICMLLIPRRYFRIDSRILADLCQLFAQDNPLTKIKSMKDNRELHQFLQNKLQKIRKKTTKNKILDKNLYSRLLSTITGSSKAGSSKSND